MAPRDDPSRNGIRGRRWWRRRPRYVYVSYHKCATQFTERVLRAVCGLHGLRAKTFDSRHSRVPWRALRRADFLMLTDFSSSMVDLESLDARGLYVTRDPRDILVSMYYSHRSSHPPNHPEIVRDREALATLEVGPGLRYLMRESRFFERIVSEMARWPERNLDYHHTTFQRLTGNPRHEFDAALRALGLDVDDELLDRILEENSFEALKREWKNRNPGHESNHYRRGRAGEWKRHLVGEIGAEFDERYGETLARLGYDRVRP